MTWNISWIEVLLEPHRIDEVLRIGISKSTTNLCGDGVILWGDDLFGMFFANKIAVESSDFGHFLPLNYGTSVTFWRGGSLVILFRLRVYVDRGASIFTLTIRLLK